MKKTIKLIPAIVMLLVSAILVSTSTYAWFSMNNRVTVTGMVITTKVDNNLLIAPSTAGTTKAADSAFTKALNQEVTGVLQPTSTINAADTTFYYTHDAKADGSKATATAQVPYTLVTGNDIEINTTHYKAYVDYVFELKAINAGSATQKVNLTKLNLLYAGAAVTEHAYRVAVFVQEQSGASAYAERGTNAGYIFAPTGFAYFTANSAVNSTTTVAAVSPVVNSAKVALDVTAGQTKYFKVTVRLWLEGEDTDCYNTKFVDLTDDWRLDLAFALEADDTNAVQLIGSVANAATADGTTATVTLDGEGKLANGETPVTYAWKNAADGTAASGTGADTATFSASASGSYYCEITTVNGNVYRTNVVDVTVGP